MPRSTLQFSNRAVVAATLFFLLVPLAAAQLNWEGQTGGLTTPFAYTSSSSMGVGRPQLALHYLNGGAVLGSDFQVSATVGFLKIAEGGFTRTFNVLGNDELAPLFANGFNAAHIKFRVLPENAWHKSFVPALAAGAIVRTQVRRVTEVTERENTTATDFFLVGTKTLANLRVPIVLNLGAKLDERLHLRYRGEFAGMGGQTFRWSLYLSQGTAAQSAHSRRGIRAAAAATERGAGNRGSYYPQLSGPVAARERCPADTRTRVGATWETTWVRGLIWKPGTS